MKTETYRIADGFVITDKSHGEVFSLIVIGTREDVQKVCNEYNSSGYCSYYISSDEMVVLKSNDVEIRNIK